jgi:hypothetical protein
VSPSRSSRLSAGGGRRRSGGGRRRSPPCSGSPTGPGPPTAGTPTRSARRACPRRAGRGRRRAPRSTLRWRRPWRGPRGPGPGARRPRPRCRARPRPPPAATGRTCPAPMHTPSTAWRPASISYRPARNPSAARRSSPLPAGSSRQRGSPPLSPRVRVSNTRMAYPSRASRRAYSVGDCSFGNVIGPRTATAGAGPSANQRLAPPSNVTPLAVARHRAFRRAGDRGRSPPGAVPVRRFAGGSTPAAPPAAGRAGRTPRAPRRRSA